MASAGLADRNGLRTDAALVTWIALSRLAEAPVEFWVRVDPHVMREASLGPARRRGRIVLLQMFWTPAFFGDCSIILEPGRLVASGALEILLVFLSRDAAAQDAFGCWPWALGPFDRIWMDPEAGAGGVAAKVQIQAMKTVRQTLLERRKLCRRNVRVVQHLFLLPYDGQDAVFESNVGRLTANRRTLSTFAVGGLPLDSLTVM